MKIDRIPARARVSFIPGVAAACAVAVVSGCMGSPTYGTGRSANAQLLDDLTGIVSTDTLIASQSGRSEIAYTPRPELVRPASLEVLPEPQQNLASGENPQWPESPEQRRARIRAEATANRDSASYRAPVQGSAMSSAPTSSGATLTGPEAAQGRPTAQMNTRRSDVQAAAQARVQGEPVGRRHLSDPPTVYRTPADSAPVGELGQDEWQKEQATRRTGGSSWRDFVPWL